MRVCARWKLHVYYKQLYTCHIYNVRVCVFLCVYMIKKCIFGKTGRMNTAEIVKEEVNQLKWGKWLNRPVMEEWCRKPCSGR